MGESTEKPPLPGMWRKKKRLLGDGNEKYGLWIQPEPVRKWRESDKDAESVRTNQTGGQGRL